MADAWARWRERGAAGILWVDPDIVADPSDLEAISGAVNEVPDQVYVGFHKLWPASTGRDDWVWGFGPWVGNMPVMGQGVSYHPGWFALGFTWTPARLLEAAAVDLPCWEYGMVDMGLSRTARERGVPIVPAWGCEPKHLHFYPREGDGGWRA